MSVRERRDDLRSLYTPGSRKYWTLKRDSARVLYNALKVNADDEGRLEGDVEDVEALVPRARGAGWTTKSIEKDLEDMVTVGLIERYPVEGRLYISICHFYEKQNWTGIRSEESKLPAPPRSQQDEIRSQSQVADIGRSSDSATPTNGMDRSFSKSSKEESLASSAPAQGSHTLNLGANESYRAAKSIFRRFVGKSMGSLGNRAWEWQELVQKEGSDVVVAAVEFWSQDIGKRGRDLRWPVAVFLKQAQDWIAEAKAARDATTATEDDDRLPRLVVPD